MATIKLADWETPEGLALIGGWARDGIIDKDIAYNIGVSEGTFNRWKKRSPAILNVLKESKQVVDRKVENALLKRALGYEYTEVTEEVDPGTGKVLARKTVTKEVQPNTTAQIFWLKNRLPKIWRDHPELFADNSSNQILESLTKLLNTPEKENPNEQPNN